MYTDFLKDLKEELKKDLPGEKAQIKMAPGVRNHFKSSEKSRNAGVLILIYEKNQEIYISFILRTEYNGPHSGQISFPGGKYEDGDKSIIETALRETHEEIGINPEMVDIYGQLTPLHIPVSNFIVYPIIGIHKTTPLFDIDPLEVKKVIEVRLNDLLNPDNCTSKEFKYGDLSFIAPIYNPDNITIWGATAMILSEFLEIVRKNNTMFQV
ncbi:MAG TPA: coenzyme A pyrophosphatase [Bacteroidales bacterium]|nr:coenzyme A pyrophosphatase [Bacteroidales bacterium]